MIIVRNINVFSNAEEEVSLYKTSYLFAKYQAHDKNVYLDDIDLFFDSLLGKDLYTFQCRLKYQPLPLCLNSQR